VSKDDKAGGRDQGTSGQVKHDDRGNAVWHWAADTARTAINSTSQLLRKLDVSSLSLESESKDREEPDLPQTPTSSSAASSESAKALQIEETTPTKARPKAGTSKIDTRGRGFNPYSTNAGTGKRAAAAAPEVTRRPAAPAPRRSWWQRLLRRD
jgi:hypothetical protein